VQPVEPTLADALEDANWLSPFGVDIRYPTDFPETLPGDEAGALRGFITFAAAGQATPASR
jgi:hypothetical protein